MAYVVCYSIQGSVESIGQYMWKPLFCPVSVLIKEVSLIIPICLEAESDYILNLCYHTVAIMCCDNSKYSSLSYTSYILGAW